MSELKVKIEQSLFGLDGKYDLLTSPGSKTWAGGHSLTVDELKVVRDCIDDFLTKLDNKEINK